MHALHATSYGTVPFSCTRTLCSTHLAPSNLFLASLAEKIRWCQNAAEGTGTLYRAMAADVKLMPAMYPSITWVNAWAMQLGRHRRQKYDEVSQHANQIRPIVLPEFCLEWSHPPSFQDLWTPNIMSTKTFLNANYEGSMQNGFTYGFEDYVPEGRCCSVNRNKSFIRATLLNCTAPSDIYCYWHAI